MSSSEAATATKAIVYEFTCLFTHDLKRKQKRWQDGKLKYHTFNGKVMVYDDRGNYVGESRWQEEEELADGDEFPLDRGGAIVQVSECTGSHEQSLADLVDKRAKEVQQRRIKKAARQGGRTGFSTPQSSIAEPPRAIVGHRPLNTLIASPARIGRAVVPTKSPYEVRNVAKPGETEGDTPPSGTSKRRREVSPPSKQGHARALFGTQLSFANPSSIAQARRQVLSQRPTNVGSSAYTSQLQFTKASPESTTDSTSTHFSKAEQAERDQRSEKSEQPQPEPPTKAPEKHRPKAQRRSSSQHDVVKSSSTAISVDKIAPEAHISHHSILVEDESDNSSRGGQLVEEYKKHKRQRGQDLELEPQDHLREAKRQRQREQRVEHTRPVSGVEVIDLYDERGPESTIRTTSKLAPMKPDVLPLIEDEPLPLAKPKPAKRKALLSVVGRRAPNGASARGEEGSNDAPTRPTETDSSATPLPYKPTGPRTELRIGSRKKRGLLMMSERKLIGAPRPRAAASHNCLGHTECTASSGNDASARKPESRATRERTQLQPKPQDQVDDVARRREFQSSKGKRTQKEQRETEILADEESLFVQSSPPSSEGDVESEPCTLTRQVSRHDEEDIENSKKPRIARLARKSVRSREIFGYVPEDVAPSTAFSAAAPQNKVFEETSANLDVVIDITQSAEEAATPFGPGNEVLADDDVPSDQDEMIGDALRTQPKEASAEIGTMLNSQDVDAAFEEWLAQMSSPPDAHQVKDKVPDEAESPRDIPSRDPEASTAKPAHAMPEEITLETVQPAAKMDNEAGETNLDEPLPAEEDQTSNSPTILAKGVPDTIVGAQDGGTVLESATAPLANGTNHVSMAKDVATTSILSDSGAQDTEIVGATKGQIDRLPPATLTNDATASMFSEDKLHAAQNGTPQSSQETAPEVAGEIITEPARDDAKQAAYDEKGPILRDVDSLGQGNGSGKGPDFERSSAVQGPIATDAQTASGRQLFNKAAPSSKETVKTLHPAATKAPPSPEALAATETLTEPLAVSDGQTLDKAPAASEPPPENSNGGKPRILVNPATRGKKAASKAHAAGSVPRGLVQLDPPSMAPVPRRQAPVMPVPRKTGNVGAMPAFEKASGGAWSAHAGDLLGISHPRKK